MREGGRRAYLAKAEFSPCVFDEGFVVLGREGDHNIWPEPSHREPLACGGESRVEIIKGCVCGKQERESICVGGGVFQSIDYISLVWQR